MILSREIPNIVFS